MTRLHAFNREQLLASARGELFGTAAGRLPNDPMLMFDRITDIHEDGGPHGKGMVRAELDIRPDLWFFGCHFIGDPVMPGCLGLDAMWQLTGFFLTWIGAPGRGRADREPSSSSVSMAACSAAARSEASGVARHATWRGGGGRAACAAAYPAYASSRAVPRAARAAPKARSMASGSRASKTSVTSLK